jgi:hypothetical protein
MSTLKRLAIAVLLLACSACGGSSNPSAASTLPTVTVGPQTVLFEGTLDPGGFAFYSYTVQQTGNTSVMLASVSTSTAPNATSTVALGMAFGTPLGTDCSFTNPLTASAALTSPMVTSQAPGTYCVRVFDVGNLRSTINFAVRIVHT